MQQLHQKKREQNRIMEEIEKLKFKQDVKTGLTYFDKVKEIVSEGEKEVSDMKTHYEDKIQQLLMITKVADQKKIREQVDQQKIVVEGKQRRSKSKSDEKK